MPYAQFVTERRLRRIQATSPTVFYAYPQGVDPRLIGGTFARADASTCATYIDVNGVVQTVAANIPRNQHFVPGLTALGPLLLLEGSRANLATYSSDFSNAAWVKTGTLGLTAGQADPAGGTSAYLLNATVSADLAYQTMGFTADATKVMSIFLKAGSAAETDLRIQDSSVGPTDRHHIRVTWTAGVPSLSTIAGAGTLFTPQALTGGWYRIAFSATGVIAANSNRCGIFPARVAGATGTVYAWGFQPENATFPSSYIPTTTAAVTRAADALSFPFLPVPQAMTGYADIVAIQPSSVSSLNAIFGIGGAAAYLQAYQNNGAPSVEWNAFYSSTNHATGVATTLAVGTRLETRVTLLADGSTGGGTATGGGTETAAAASTTGILPAAWTAPTLSVANFASTSVPSFLALRSLKIAAGVQTMATMRAL